MVKRLEYVPFKLPSLTEHSIHSNLIEAERLTKFCNKTSDHMINFITDMSLNCWDILLNAIL